MRRAAGTAPSLFIHIGAHKTGTSALQSFLARNFEGLRQRGLLYPDSHTSSLASVGRTTSGNGSALILQMRDEKHAKGTAFRKQLEHHLKHSSDCRILLSSEMFWGNDFHLLPLVAELARRTGRDAVIIIYLRPQSEAILSAWAEWVKRHGFTGTPTDYFKSWKSHFEYLPKLDQLENWFGRDQLVVRPYAREAFKNGDLISDFLEIFGLDHFRDEGEPPLAVNISLSEPEIALFRSLNRLGVGTRALANLFDQVPAPAAGRTNLPDETLAKAISASYADSNAEISERYFRGRDWLSRVGPTRCLRKEEIAEDNRTLAIFLVRAAEMLGRMQQTQQRSTERTARLEARIDEQAEMIQKLEAQLRGAPLGDP